MSSYPSLQTLLEQPDPHALLKIRRSFRSVLSSLTLFFLLTFAVYVLNLYFQNSHLRWLALIPAGVLLEVLRKYHNDLYVLGTHSLTSYHGRLSLSYSVPTLKYGHIRSVSVDQDIWGRIFDYGDISIQTAASDDNELLMVGVRNPVALATLIEELRNHSREQADKGESEEAVEETKESDD